LLNGSLEDFRAAFLGACGGNALSRLCHAGPENALRRLTANVPYRTTNAREYVKRSGSSRARDSTANIINTFFGLPLPNAGIGLRRDA
jgi:hypothetical protein